jgi:hypothetical protein
MKAFRAILGIVFVCTMVATAQAQMFQWKLTSAAPGNYQIATSFDCKKIFADFNFGMMISTNYGNTWGLRIIDTNGSSGYSASVACSSSGDIIISADAGNCTSVSYDGGLHWHYVGYNFSWWTTDIYGNAIWTNYQSEPYGAYSVSISTDGSKMFAATFENLYASSDFGATWNPLPTDLSWYWNIATATSSDGNKLLIAPHTGIICTSTNGGTTWNHAPYYLDWKSVDCSSDGKIQYAASSLNTPPLDQNSDGIYCSTNSGVTWNKLNSPNSAWKSIACSADGSFIAAASYGSGIYVSPDYGHTWKNSGAPSKAWQSIKVSSDGKTIVGAVYGGGIYVGRRK